MSVKKSANTLRNSSSVREAAALCGRSLCAYNKELADQLRAAKKYIKKLESLRDRDHMTGLLNKRAVQKELLKIIADIKNAKPVKQAARKSAGKKNKERREEPKFLAAVMIDLDKFKQINDVLGHAAGDLVLKNVANTLGKTMRGDDILCHAKAARYGGEEMFVIFRCAKENDVACVAEKIRAAIEAAVHITPTTNMPFSVTASLGSTALSYDLVKKYGKDKTIKELFLLSDYALYASKVNGRNLESYVDAAGNLIIGATTYPALQPLKAPGPSTALKRGEGSRRSRAARTAARP